MEKITLWNKNLGSKQKFTQSYDFFGIMMLSY